MQATPRSGPALVPRNAALFRQECARWQSSLPQRRTKTRHEPRATRYELRATSQSSAAICRPFATDLVAATALQAATLQGSPRVGRLANLAQTNTRLAIPCQAWCFGWRMNNRLYRGVGVPCVIPLWARQRWMSGKVRAPRGRRCASAVHAQLVQVSRRCHRRQIGHRHVGPNVEGGGDRYVMRAPLTASIDEGSPLRSASCNNTRW